ncbi:flagellar basal-body rod protein [Azotobacter vinelandii CA]|uniref:Flagellar basal-body rod protein FlgF n=2 Tax=Azotobacter vinelandii TaxID=354 RepID=C1DHJ6_AZOVD|nr:flagellar basal body rod protein FlgF [Azotobacter vinelandii]ACO78591.1 flagellar basal-body rod protein [Azotobacter vinelandii DJ]AGK13477.1 flagellar basal-body rod protein [Azotobacter vinelandii CA]AGK17888.1 flagellar basal-body rod protein [Azotobacter vinelandii CA6]WKN24273.1 flagellar basal body rod protein FlgF [Azotobacter vinelandii]SFX89598.1 flagellar basal-body rod protein FlgF [Azotobacter vinelandii]
MDRMLFTAMSGAKQSLDQQAVVAHNLANAVTPGFRAQLMELQAVPVDGEGLPTRVSVRATTSGVDFSQGPVTRTGRPLDVALDGNAWLAIQAADGSEAYTRRGDVQIDGNGLMTVAGHPLIGDGGPLTVPLGSQVSIGADGTVSVVEEGQDPDTSAVVARLKLVSAAPGELERGEDGLFRAPPDDTGVSQPLAVDETARLVTGALEGSNVSATEAMVAMIDNARRYEMQMKAIDSADDNAQRANALLSLQG